MRIRKKKHNEPQKKRPMYEVEILAENLSPISLEAVKAYLRLEGCDSEDSLIEQQVKTAIKVAENYCNRAFTEKEVLTRSNDAEFSLLGILDKVIEVKQGGEVVTNGYAVGGVKNPTFLSNGGRWEVKHKTKADMPPEVQEFVNQYVYKLYERGEEIPAPDYELLKPLRNLIWLV